MNSVNLAGSRYVTNVRLCIANKRLDVEAPFFCARIPVDEVRSHANSHSNRQRPWSSFSRSKIRIEYIRDYLANGDRWGKRLLLPIPIVACGHLIGIFTFTLFHSKGQGRGYEYIDCKYVSNGNLQIKHYYYHKIESHTLALVLYIYIWPWPILKVKVMHISQMETEQTRSCQQIGNRIWPFDWHICTWPWPILKIKFKGSCTLHFECQYLYNGDR